MRPRMEWMKRVDDWILEILAEQGRDLSQWAITHSGLDRFEWVC